MSSLHGMAAAIALALATKAEAGEPGDPRLREVIYDPRAMLTVPVKRGVVTLVVLDADETINEVGAGLGGDCAKPESAWCVAAQPGGRTVFVKAKSAAAAPNTLAVVTDRRAHAFRFVVLEDSDPKVPVYRLEVKAPTRSVPMARMATPAPSPSVALPALPVAPVSNDTVTQRLQAKPPVKNSQYSIAEGVDSRDIVPTLVFDDGRFTYLRFEGNRELPSVFHVMDDGSEALVNTRMEDDLLIVDRVSRRMALRAGSAVVGLWNEAFEADGLPPAEGTTVSGVQRAIRTTNKSPAYAGKGAQQ